MSRESARRSVATRAQDSSCRPRRSQPRGRQPIPVPISMATAAAITIAWAASPIPSATAGDGSERCGDEHRQRMRQRHQQSAHGSGGEQHIGGGCRGDRERERAQAREQPGEECRQRNEAAALLTDQQAERQQRQYMGGQRQRMQQAADEAAHPIPRRKATPASAMAPPAARTAMRPAGQRASRPNAMPTRCSIPVATTNPTE